VGGEGPADFPTTLRHPRISLWQSTACIVRKDLQVELRAREILPPVLVFALLVIVIFQFTLPTAPSGVVLGAPGALWVALLFGSTLGLSRALGSEIDGGGMTGLLLAPIDRGALFLGKWLSGWLFSLAVAACLLVAGTAWLNLPPAQLPALAAVLALGLAGWTAAGTLLGAMAVRSRAREVLLPVLLYPVVLPLVIPAVRLTELLLAPEAAAAEGLMPLVALIVAYDIILFVLGFLLMPFVVTD
jgi:heme exporter protein B